MWELRSVYGYAVQKCVSIPYFQQNKLPQITEIPNFETRWSVQQFNFLYVNICESKYVSPSGHFHDMATKLLSSIFLLAWCFRTVIDGMTMHACLWSTIYPSSKMIIPGKVTNSLFLNLLMFITVFPYTNQDQMNLYEYFMSTVNQYWVG